MSATDIDFGASAREGWRIGEMFANVFWNVALFLIRPCGLLTQVFFRKEMGERYMSPVPVLVATLLLVVTYVTTEHIAIVPPTLLLYLKLTDARTATTWYFPRAEIWVMSIWMLVFAAAVWENKFRAWRRYRNGDRWHSKSMGVPRIPWVGNLLQYTLPLVAAIFVDVAGLTWVALLIVSSVVATVLTDYAVARQLYNSVLDVLDAELESETLNQAVKARLSPKHSNGMAVWLPRSVSRYLVIRQDAFKSGAHSSASSVHSVVETKPDHSKPEVAAR